ncbi:DUF6891 domain-containing protein [Kitasatospora aureofaciens]|uniref:DUF6891 domain-containing protein n=1 Tax=Kitasatospora aureofaciens TaxID=1894 RepID=A0A1E7MYP8_KITAU|nr:hypothetical protein [Kitasatospora aureofaciens]QEV01912.1 hypothetical protein CP971_24100 [Streptomyces viridifaciens]ARF80660.1 hypothetical protein B6264_18675 [Kitasatospora aureofaciens]OEV33556.1 hypothetical protein HS99_0013455 [Kitasatospora aureofaciens]UKZ08373.1 hypothetical protein BOQ63_031010 [Streptomyces viridifaciens]GGU60935.1 hypothetical protein GCM10010502_09440 [Kitasatospora aureofaciens]
MTQDTDTALSPDVLLEARERARELIRCGFQEPDEIAESLVEVLDDQGLTQEEAERIVAPLWTERLAEQAHWPETTDVDRLMDAFDLLEDQGIVAAMDFTCCAGCGYAEIGGEADEDSRGFVFFHQQDTEAAAAGRGLMLRYGAFSTGEAPGGETDGESDAESDAESEEAAGRRTAEIGRTVVAALEAVGLPVEWNGSPRTAIRVAPLEWLNRLPE